MSKKLILLALAAVSAAMFALPAAASAGEWEIHSNVVIPFTVTGGAATWTVSNGETVSCETTTGTGAYESTTGGTVSLFLHGCKSFSTKCTTPGLSSGTIAVAGVFTNVYLDAEGVHETPGFTFTGLGGTNSTIASFKCAFGLVTMSLAGTINGHLEKQCNEGQTETSTEVEFASGETHGEVLWPFVTEDSELAKDDLAVEVNSQSLTGSMDATWTLQYPKGVKAGVSCV